MARNGNFDRQGRSAVTDGPHDLVDNPRETRHALAEPKDRPRLRVRVIERVAIVRFSGAEILIEEGAVGGLVDQLEGLVASEGHARFVLNFSGVRYVSCALLGELDRLQNEVEHRGGRIQICGLDPLLRDVLRTCRLDLAFDAFGDEAEALGLIAS